MIKLSFLALKLSKKVSAEALLQEYAEGSEIKELAKKYGVSYDVVHELILSFPQYKDLKKEKGKRKIQRVLPEFMALAKKLGRIPSFLEAHAQMPIAHAYLYSQLCMQARSKGYHRVKTAPLPVPGSLRSKVTPEALMDQYKCGTTAIELANKYNVSIGRIRQYLSILKEEYKQATKVHKSVAVSRKDKALPAFIELTKKLGRIPEPEEAMAPLQIERFGLYFVLKNAASKLGYKTKYKAEKALRDERKRSDMLAYLQKLAARLGRTPYIQDINAGNRYWGSEYALYFGKLSRAQTLAGLKPNRAGNSHERAVRNGQFITKEKYIEEIKRIERKIKRKPTWADIAKYSVHDVSTFRYRLGKQVRKYVHYKHKLKMK
jgi:Mor family transcriptional regulator